MACRVITGHMRLGDRDRMEMQIWEVSVYDFKALRLDEMIRK